MVGSYTELLRRKYKGRLDADADEYINFAVEGVKRMQALINDLLEYARAGEDQDKQPERVNAEEVLEAVLLNLQPRIEEAGAVVTRDRLPAVLAYRTGLTQVLQNLIGNALKYRSDRPPKVHVGVSERAGEAVFSISDNGIGIDPKYKDQVFGIFKRLHGSEFEGTGIGLAMCKKIVERSGGRIWVESQAGAGSTFFFTVPLPTRVRNVAKAS
jgi:light-regulated signal transduction histidine kinase (bacteriophytochrome)